MLCRTPCNQSAAATDHCSACCSGMCADGGDGDSAGGGADGPGAQWSSVGTPVTQLPHMPVVPGPAQVPGHICLLSPHCYDDAPGTLLHCSTAPMLPLHMVSQCCSGTCCSLITPSINQYLARAETKQRPDNKWDNQQWAAGYLS